MSAAGSGPERSFARPFRGLGDRVASRLSAAIGVAPEQVVRGAGVGRRHVPEARAAIVVGGGLAGMSAAIRLAACGYRVRVLERGATLGGKLAAWPHRLADGTRLTVEHGFHGFFLHYYGLYALLREAGVEVADFPMIDDYAIADAEGRVESLRGYPRTPPFSALAMARSSPFLNLREARRMRDFAVMRDAFLAFDVERTPERWDGVSFADLLERMGLAGTGFEAIFKVFGHSFFSEASAVSAAEIAKHFHAFFFANPEGLLFRYCRTDFERAIWRPLERHLTTLGGIADVGAEVVSLEPGPGGRGLSVRWRRRGDRPGASDSPGSDTGSARDGARAASEVRATERLDADAVVLAVDPPGLRAILERSYALRAAHPEVGALIDRVPPGQPYAVLRLWADRDCAVERASFTSLCGRYPLDSITVYHRLEEESAAWRTRHGGGVYELHSYTPRAEDAREPERLLAAMERELGGAFPELDGMAIRDRYAQVRWDFPSFPVGRAARRPTTETGVPGLVLAGDWVRLPVPAALMEAAVVSGIAAANAIGARDGIAPHAIWSVPRRGVLAGVRASARRRGRALARAIAVSRPLFWLNSAALCAIAAMLADRAPGAAATALVVFATLPLNLFVYALNDLHDHASDRCNPRKGSAEGARASRADLKRLARIAAAVNAPFVALFAVTGGAASRLALGAIYAVAWAYSAPPLRLKSRPGWDSLANAGYVLPLVFAFLYLEVPDPPWRETLAFAIWAIGSHALTSVQDVAADRAAGLATIATRLGPRAAAGLALVAYVLAGALVALDHGAIALVLAPYAALALWVRASRSGETAHRAYRLFMAWNLVVGFALTTWIALAHERATAWAAVTMLLVCAAVAAAVRVAARAHAAEASAALEGGAGDAA